MNLLTYDFMVRALLGALFTGLAAPAVGTYLVQRRLSLMGDGIGHIAVTGVALGLLTGTSPTLTAVIVAVIGATVIELVRLSGRATGDVALALLFYGGIAGGVLLTGIAGQSAATLNIYLFGSITTISPTDVWVTAALALVVVSGRRARRRSCSRSRRTRSSRGSPGSTCGFYNLLVAVMAAVTVTVAMRTVGLLLVSALMVVPVATSQQVTRGVPHHAVRRDGDRHGRLARRGDHLGVRQRRPGSHDRAAGAGRLRRRLPGRRAAAAAAAARAARSPRRSTRSRCTTSTPTVPEEHAHQHGDDCGHAAVPHGDHVDYVHDGHRHAPHGSHYDEH